MSEAADTLLDRLGRWLAGRLQEESSGYEPYTPSDPQTLRRTLEPGDILLIEGNQRISATIKYLTQSTWSHAALCVGDYPGGPGAGPHFIEADALAGVHMVSCDAFADLHVRICRAVGLDTAEIDAICGFAIARLGHDYDLRNVFDLARYLFPTPPVPAGWRRRMIALGSGEPTKAICSSLIAQAFQSVRYPILPIITREMVDDRDCRDCIRDILHIRHHSLFVPRDFDVSPYFEVIKPTLDASFNPRTLFWADVACDEPAYELHAPSASSTGHSGTASPEHRAAVLARTDSMRRRSAILARTSRK